MKTRIGDETLAYLIDIFEHRPDEFQNITVVAALSELQDYRAAQHERRWRKIADEGLPKEDGKYDFVLSRITPESYKNTNVNRMRMIILVKFVEFLEVDNNWDIENLGRADANYVRKSFTHWRPQDTDLPEAE